MLRQALCRALLVVGTAAALAYPLADLVTGRGPQLTWLSNEYVPFAFYLIGAFLVLKRPDHPVARRLLLCGTAAIVSATLGQLVSVAYVENGLQSWLWLATALQTVTETGFLAALVAVFAVFPDGHYQRRYERWTVWGIATLPWLITAVELLALSTLPVNPFFFLIGLFENDFFLGAENLLAANFHGLDAHHFIAHQPHEIYIMRSFAVDPLLVLRICVPLAHFLGWLAAQMPGYSFAVERHPAHLFFRCARFHL